ncbi:MAG TPA: sigma-70 family RNA polymerase sigma factor [Vicinamibacterales bacterium]|nr:sigma-70 family RNA polymerase sigma factor [Vicinamibacterales bacterium]
MAEFDAVYRAHVQSVFRFALRAVSNRALAEDLTAEAFLELYRRRDEIDATRLPAWLLTVVRNKARDHWRRQQVERRYAEQENESEAVDPPALERWILDSADLKPVHRTCLMLRYVHGMARTEIAESMGLSETQVKGHLQYALELLRKTYVKGGAR